MIFAGGSGAFISLIIPIIYPSLITLFISQALVGISHNCMMISMQRGAGSASANRDKAIASLTFVFAIAEFIGPLFSGFSYEHMGFRFTFMAASFSILIMLLINSLLPAKAMQNNSKGEVEEKRNSFTLLKSANVRKALVASGLVVYSKDLFVAYFPAYGSKIGLTPSQIGIVIAFTAVASMIVRALQPVLVTKFSRETVLMYSMFLGGAAYVTVPFLQNFYILCALALLLGAGLGLGQPLSLVLILNSSPPGREGELLGLRITFNRLCQLSAPTLYGILGGSMGLPPIFWTCGVFLFSGSWYSRNSRNKAISIETTHPS